MLSILDLGYVLVGRLLSIEAPGTTSFEYEGDGTQRSRRTAFPVFIIGKEPVEKREGEKGGRGLSILSTNTEARLCDLIRGNKDAGSRNLSSVSDVGWA